MTLNIVFSHGKESGPWGSKIKSMAEHVKQLGAVHSIDYQDLACPDERTDRLERFLKTLSGEIILVGSSMGGYVSNEAANRVKVAGILLLAPAFYLQGYQVVKPVINGKNISIVHGWADDIVPVENSIKFAKEFNAELKLVNDGHRLSNSIDVLKLELERVIKLRAV